VSETEVEAGQIGVGVELPLEELIVTVGLTDNVGQWSRVGTVVLRNPR